MNNIELSKFREWLTTFRFDYAHSTRERKTLRLRYGGGFEILIANKIVWEGVQPVVAVEVYNAITDEYMDDTIKKAAK